MNLEKPYHLNSFIWDLTGSNFQLDYFLCSIFSYFISLFTHTAVLMLSKSNTLIYQKICSHTGSISIYLVLIWKLESQQHFPKLSPEMISDVEHIYTQSGWRLNNLPVLQGFCSFFWGGDSYGVSEHVWLAAVLCFHLIACHTCH